MGKWTAEEEVASLVARMNWTPNAATRARSLAVALVALCSLAVVIDKAVYTTRVELAEASDGGRCDDKCQVAWIQHLEVVKRKLAEEHKKPSLTPTKPLPHAKATTPTQRLVTHKPRAQKWSAAAEIAKARAAAKTPSAVKAQMIHLGLTGEVKRIKIQSIKSLHFAQHSLHSAAHKQPHLVKRLMTAKVPLRHHMPADQAKVKVAESILGMASLVEPMNPKAKNKRAALARSEKVGGKNFHSIALKKWPHDPHYWQRLGYGGSLYQPWQAAHQQQENERSHVRVDHTLDFMHISGGRANQDNRHTFASLRHRVRDHTLDYMHLPADHGDPETNELRKLSGGNQPLQDRAWKYLHSPEDNKHKVDIEAVDTINSYEAFEPKGKGAAEQLYDSYERQNLE